MDPIHSRPSPPHARHKAARLCKCIRVAVSAADVAHACNRLRTTTHYSHVYGMNMHRKARVLGTVTEQTLRTCNTDRHAHNGWKPRGFGDPLGGWRPGREEAIRRGDPPRVGSRRGAIRRRWLVPRPARGSAYTLTGSGWTFLWVKT